MPLFTTQTGKRVCIHKDAWTFVEPGEGGLTSKVTAFGPQGLVVIEVSGTVDTVGRVLEGVLPAEGGDA